MRVLFTTRPLTGHYYPMRPLMRACAEAGDEVAVAGGSPIDEQARRDGFTAYRAGLDAAHPEGVRLRRVLTTLPPDEIRRFAFGEWFVRTEMPPRARDLDRPDLR
jgi:hypothetical protein